MSTLHGCDDERKHMKKYFENHKKEKLLLE